MESQPDPSPRSQDDMFLRSTEIIAHNQIVFRADSDGNFGGPKDFVKFFERVDNDSKRFSRENPPQPELFAEIINNIGLFNKIWEYSLKDVVRNSKLFLEKVLATSPDRQKQLLISAQHSIEEVSYYCNTWLHKIAELYRYQVQLAKMIADGSNANHMIRGVDFSSRYYMSDQIGDILRGFSELDLSPRKARRPSQAESLLHQVRLIDKDLDVFIKATIDPSNVALIFYIDAESDFATIEDYGEFFMNIFKDKDLTDSQKIFQHVGKLDKILSYIFRNSLSKINELVEKSKNYDKKIQILTGARVKVAVNYLFAWLPIFVKLYQNEFQRLLLSGFEMDNRLLKDKRPYFTEQAVDDLLNKLPLLQEGGI